MILFFMSLLEGVRACFNAGHTRSWPSFLAPPGGETPVQRLANFRLFFHVGLLQDPVTYNVRSTYKISLAGAQVTQWDFDLEDHYITYE